MCICPLARAGVCYRQQHSTAASVGTQHSGGTCGGVCNLLVQVVHDGEQPTDGSELLNSFNVATFKADEDDAAFWNRLIPVTERPKDEPAAAFEDLGTRSTRYRAVDDVRPPSHSPPVPSPKKFAVLDARLRGECLELYRPGNEEGGEMVHSACCKEQGA